MEFEVVSMSGSKGAPGVRAKYADIFQVILFVPIYSSCKSFSNGILTRMGIVMV